MANTIDWSQAPVPDPGQYANDPNTKKQWQSAVGQDENWLEQEMASGKEVTGAVPSMFKGDILQLNQYGQLFPNVNFQKNEEWHPQTNGPGYYTQLSASDDAALSAYRAWTTNQENQPGGGAVDAWGQYETGNPDTASGDWSGAYSAYMAAQAMAAGESPDQAAFGATTSDPGMFESNGDYLSDNTQLFNQFGIPIAGGVPATAPTGAVNTNDTTLSPFVAPETGGNFPDYVVPPNPTGGVYLPTQGNAGTEPASAPATAPATAPAPTPTPTTPPPTAPSTGTPTTPVQNAFTQATTSPDKQNRPAPKPAPAAANPPTAPDANPIGMPDPKKSPFMQARM